MNYLFFFQEAEKVPLQWAESLVLPVFFLVIATTVLAILMSMYNMAQNPGSIKRFLMGLVVLAAILILGYVVSSGTLPTALKDLPMANGQVYKWVGASLFTAFILMGVGFVFLLLDLIRGMFKI